MPTELREWKKIHFEISNIFFEDRDKCLEKIEQIILDTKDQDSWNMFWRAFKNWRFQDHHIVLAQQLIGKSLSLEPNNSLFLMLQAVIFRESGEIKKAISFYKKSINKDKKNEICWNSYGYTLALSGEIDSAIDKYNESIKINSEYVPPWFNIADSYLKKGEYANAVNAYEQAYGKTKNHRYVNIILQGLCKAAIECGDNEKAIDAYNKLKDLSRSNPEIRWNLGYLEGRLNLECGVCRDSEVDNTESSLKFLRGFIDFIQSENSKECKIISKLLNDKVENEKKMLKFIENGSRFDRNRTFFMGLRKWNSYTPALPNDDQRSIGGGYYIYHRGHGIVIDPGFNFIENFHAAGGRLEDIQDVIITHAHNDHTNDLESLLTLFYQRNKRIAKTKNIDNFASHHSNLTLYLNLGTMKKFSGMLDLRNADHIKIHILNNDSNYIELSPHAKLFVLPAYHDEIISIDYSVGLCLDLSLPDGSQRRILFTGDTSLFPYPSSDQKRNGMEVDINGKQVWEKYIEKLPDLIGKIDLLIPHLGSVKKEEFATPPPNNLEMKKNIIAFSKLFYNNHLGLLGCLQILCTLQPRVAFVSEFGEELKSNIVGLASFMTKFCESYFAKCKLGAAPIVLPCELNLFYDLEKEEVYNLLKENFSPIKDILLRYTGKRFHYTTEEENSLHERVEDLYKKMLTNMLTEKKGIFFDLAEEKEPTASD